jgi:hypothetical protein
MSRAAPLISTVFAELNARYAAGMAAVVEHEYPPMAAAFKARLILVLQSMMRRATGTCKRDAGIKPAVSGGAN